MIVWEGDSYETFVEHACSTPKKTIWNHMSFHMHRIIYTPGPSVLVMCALVDFPVHNFPKSVYPVLNCVFMVNEWKSYLHRLWRNVMLGNFWKNFGPTELENFQYGSRSSEEFRNLAHDIQFSEFCNGYVRSGFSSDTFKLIWFLENLSASRSPQNFKRNQVRMHINYID